MSVYDERYRRLIEKLIQARKRLGLSQDAVARQLVLDPQRPEKRYLQSFVSKVETRERRLDAIELAEFARVYRTSVAELLGEGLGLGGAALAREGEGATGASLTGEGGPPARGPDTPPSEASPPRRRVRHRS
jgi:transcriptional regulator with XRE-family HTH domain